MWWLQCGGHNSIVTRRRSWCDGQDAMTRTRRSQCDVHARGNLYIVWNSDNGICTMESAWWNSRKGICTIKFARWNLHNRRSWVGTRCYRTLGKNSLPFSLQLLWEVRTGFLTINIATLLSALSFLRWFYGAIPRASPYCPLSNNLDDRSPFLYNGRTLSAHPSLMENCAGRLKYHDPIHKSARWFSPWNPHHEIRTMESAQWNPHNEVHTTLCRRKSLHKWSIVRILSAYAEMLWYYW